MGSCISVAKHQRREEATQFQIFFILLRNKLPPVKAAMVVFVAVYVLVQILHQTEVINELAHLVAS